MHKTIVLLVYDGGCGLCTQWAHWARARLPSFFRVEPWQALELEALGLSRREVEASIWWLEDNSGGCFVRYHGAEAIGRALTSISGAWSVVGWLIVHPPVCWLARPVYAIVAANRHRISRLWFLRRRWAVCHGVGGAWGAERIDL